MHILVWLVLFGLLNGSEPFAYDNEGGKDCGISLNDNIFIEECGPLLSDTDYLSLSDEESIPSITIDNILADDVDGRKSLLLPLNLKLFASRKERVRAMHIRLKEIFSAKYPDFKYDIRKFSIKNWPADVLFRKFHWTKAELEMINERIPILEFVPNDEVISLEESLGLDQFASLTEAEVDRKLTKRNFIKTMKERFEEESGAGPEVQRIAWRLLDRRTIPPKYRDVPINSTTVLSKLIHGNKEIIDNIHFRRYDEDIVPTASTASLDLRHQSGQRLALKNDLKRLLEDQHPGAKFDLRNYDILNWPAEVDPLGHNYTSRERRLVRERFHELRFIRRESKVTSEQELGLDALGSLAGILNPDWNKRAVLQRCLEVFREETGEEQARIVQWSLFDRRDIPPRYDGIPINSRTMSLTKFFKNPEIVDNIHFFKPPTHRETQPKRKREDPEDDNAEDDEDVLPSLKNFTGDDEFSH